MESGTRTCLVTIRPIFLVHTKKLVRLKLVCPKTILVRPKVVLVRPKV